MVFPLQREWVEALTEQQQAELFTDVSGYLENGGDYLDDFNSSTRWSQQNCHEIYEKSILERLCPFGDY